MSVRTKNMNKLKTLLAVLFSCGLLLVGCNKGGDDTSSENTPTNSETSQLTPLQQALQVTRDDFRAINFTYNMTVNTVTPDGNVLLNQTTEFDNNKIHLDYTETSYLHPQSHSEMYFETGDVTYMYQKISEQWTKTAYPMDLSVNPDNSFMGYAQLMSALEQKATLVDGYFYAENVTIQINIDDFLSRTMDDFSGYTKSPEKVDYTYEYVKIGVENNHISFIELKTYAYQVQSNEELHTVTVIKDTNTVSVTRLSNFTKFGTTVVTLPTVA